MPTFKEDLHLGHSVPTIDTEDIEDRAITEKKMADGSVSTRTIQNGAVTEPKIANRAVTEPKLADWAVSTRTVRDKAISERKLADLSVSTRTMQDKSVTNSKIADSTISMGKLDNDVQTKIQQGTQRAWTPKGTFELGEKYDFNDLVYSEEDNSSYISLQANNEGHVPGAEGEEAWWMKVLDGSYVNVVEEELQQLVDSISEGTQQQVEELNEALEALEAQADQSRQDIQDIVNSLAVVQTTGQSASDVMSQKAVTDMFYTPISNIKELPYSTLTAGKFGTNPDVYHGIIPVIEGEEFYLTKGSAVSGNYSFVTSDSYELGGDIPLLAGTSVMQIENGAKVTIPQGCKYMLVYYSASTRPFVLYKKDLGYVDICDIQPLVTFDYIGGITGDFSNNQNFEDGTRCSTVRYIKRPKDGVIKVSADTTGSFQFYWYDAAFNFMQVHAGETYDSPNTFIEITPLINDYTYLKVCFVSNTAFHRTIITLRGRFENKEYFNTRPNNGYHRICAMVNVSNARCCNDITKDIQDKVDFRPNYGVIALPTTYSASGTPTRMIIYCHGAGTHFTFSNSTTFDTQNHVDPTYWLAEGYAVMDIDGNPMDADAHAFRPQAMSAYIEAYKWAIEHYNIYRDGVLLGGRSMGGGNTMYLLRNTCPIPIIAACANLPTSVAMNQTSATKLSIANMRGFVIPEGFTFSDGPMDDADTQVYYDNWDEAIRYIPSIALCVDTPTTEEWRKNFIKNCCHVGEPYESNRIEACKGMHMVVKAPLKMFTCIQDPNNGYQATAQLYMTMLGNAGQQAELRLYNSYKNIDYPSDSRTAHYYELADPTLRTTYTTIFGHTLTNVPKVYIEMLQFWRRFEQGM